MKKVFLALLGVALISFMASNAFAEKNGNGKWALHDAGAHNSKANTCDFVLPDCTSINTVGGSGGARDDIYVIAVDVNAIAGARYGLCCDGPLYFYGWQKCSDLEFPTSGWPTCGGGNSQSWATEQNGPHVTVGILDVYIYGNSNCLSTCVDPRVGFAQFCDGTEPTPICFTADGTDSRYFGSVEFNGSGCGFNPCSIVPTEERSWGAVKSLYR